MLTFAAITPHPPLLIPNVGKEKIDKLEKTKLALEEVEKDLYTSRPDVIFIISPHCALFSNTFSVSSDNEFESNFEDFGDLNTKMKWKGAPNLAAKIAHAGRRYGPAVNLVSEENLKHGASVPLYHLTNELPNVKILPIGYCGTDAESHLKFGELLKNIIMESDKRIAVVASGDLTHGIDEGNENTLDKVLQEALSDNDLEKILELETSVIPNTEECGYRSILILMGIIKNMGYRFEPHCYEHPFGVGYLTGTFNL